MRVSEIRVNQIRVNQGLGVSEKYSSWLGLILDPSGPLLHT